MTTTATKTRRNSRAKKAEEVAEPIVVAKPSARIRIPNDLVEAIISTPSENPTLDVLQAHLLFSAQGSTKADRIVVTTDDNVVGVMRDWMVRLIATSRNLENGNRIQVEASKVIGFIESFEEKRTAE